MKPFLESVAEYIFKHYKNNLHELSIVFPNKRARLFFNKYIGELTQTPVFAPKYFTITEYMQKLSGGNLADQLSLLFILYEVFVKVTGSKESFDDFLFYCEMLLADFDDIDKYLVDAEKLYTNLAELKDIESYYNYLEAPQIEAIKQFWDTYQRSPESEHKERFTSLWNVLFRIYSEFNKTLETHEIKYEGMAYRQANSRMKQNDFNINDNKVIFIGFNALNACEKELFDLLQQKQKALFFWDFDNYYLQQGVKHEAAYFLHELTKKFPAPKDFTFESDLTASNRPINIYNIATTTGQAKALPLILQSLPDDWKKDPLKSAVTLADEALLMPVLNALPEDIGDVNVSMGYPLSETKVFGLVSLLLELQKNKRITKEGSEFYHNDVSCLLQNGIFSTETDEIESLLSDINRNNIIYVKPEKFNILGGIYIEFFQGEINSRNFIDYLKSILQKVPQFLNSKAGNTYKIEREACLRILNQLNRIGDLLKKVEIDFSFKSLTRLLSKLLESAAIPFSGEPLGGLQIMGILETRTIDFDNLVILSLNEGIFPKSGHVPSFVPYSLRRGFGMPTIEHQDAIFAYYFYRLLHRAKNVTLVYSSSVNDSKSGDPSRFIHHLKYEEAFKSTSHTLSYSINPLTERSINITKNDETARILTQKYSTINGKLLSPSAINTYLNCQTRFYIQYIAGLKEQDTLQEDIEANTLGSILHKAMEKLYTPYKNELISREIIDSLLKNKAHLNRTILEAFYEEYLSPGKKADPNTPIELQGKNKLIKEVIQKYILVLLEYDKKIAPIHIKGLEAKYEMPFNLNNGTTINIGGIIDRIDSVNNTTRIIDYKTGSQKDSFSDLEQLFHGKATNRNSAAFQTLLYSMVLSHSIKNEDIQPGLYFVRAMRKENYSSVIKWIPSKGKVPLNKLSDVSSEFTKMLAETLNEIFSENGNFIQTEDESYCSYCPYKAICSR
jgi:CRISPR/Cas system-associated exonuclease Cas4 (RecB family)